VFVPANLTPEYKAAEAEFRKARDPEGRLRWLREMLRTVPKHKGTEHLRADIKTRVKQLTEELAGPSRGGARTGPHTSVHREGAAQVVLLGPPNSGKSTLHARLTGSHAAAGPYPFTTQFPLPGMLAFEDVAFQLVDLPPVAARHPVPWLPSTVGTADAGLLVVDLVDPGCVEQVVQLRELLAGRRVALAESWAQPALDDDSDDPFAVWLPVLLVVAKADQVPRLDDELAVFRELTGMRYPAVAVSAVTEEGLDQIGPFLFEHLGVVRVYTKLPGRPADNSRPFTLRRGQTVRDVAVLVHRDLAETLTFARLWRQDVEGRQVGRDHPVEDRDVIELHLH
jgi:ribosome-interacting GTPase 1